MAKKAKKAEALAKHRRKAEKAGLPKPESSEAIVSEIEGRKDSYWLKELMDDEEEEDPSAGGGLRPLTGGQRFLGAQRAHLILLLTRARTKPLRRVRHLRVPKEGSSRQAERPKHPWAQRSLPSLVLRRRRRLRRPESPSGPPRP